MTKPVLIIMAAGLGSRYGGLKQIAPVDGQGHILMDYALYDARQAGFDSVVFVITEALQEEFRAVIGSRVARFMEVGYAFQRLDDLPEGFAVPEGRQKPWGTAHAVLSAKEAVGGRGFCVINADDFYGSSAFASMYGFLTQNADDTHHAMVGYRIENTLTEHGHVARGVCQTDGNGYLTSIVERTKIETRPGGAAFIEGGSETFLPAGTIVSMNLWGFGHGMMEEIEARFAGFLAENLPVNPIKCEYFLPLVPNALMAEGKASFQVLPTFDRWYGVTYKEDMPAVQAALAELGREGIYPRRLWEE